MSITKEKYINRITSICEMIFNSMDTAKEGMKKSLKVTDKIEWYSAMVDSIIGHLESFIYLTENNMTSLKIIKNNSIGQIKLTHWEEPDNRLMQLRITRLVEMYKKQTTEMDKDIISAELASVIGDVDVRSAREWLDKVVVE